VTPANVSAPGTPSRTRIILILALIVALFAARNLPWHLDDYDQAKQAFVSFEMVQDGQWWFQHTPSGHIATKPPLAGWISCALYSVVRNWELAWRLPSFLCAAILAVMLWRSAYALAGGIAPLIAVCAFAFNLTAPRLATLVRTDMMLTLFIFITGWLALEKVRTGTAWTSRERLALGLAVLASMLTKGPILYAFLLPGLAAFAWLMRHRGTANRAWAGWLPWFAPLLVFAVWVGIGVWLSRDFYEQVVLREFLGRFDIGDAPVHKHQPLLFYAGHLFGKIWAPWGLVLAALSAVLCFPQTIRVLRSHQWTDALRFAKKEFRQTLRADPALLWLACWALGGFVFMSLVPSKRPDRVFPVIPPLCLLLAVLAQRWSAASHRRQRMLFGIVALAAVMSCGYAIFSIVNDTRHDARALVRFGARVQQITAAHPKRLAVGGAKDEGLLLYTGRTRFVPMDDAIESWRRGEIDWLLIREKDLREYRDELATAPRLLEVPALKGKQSPYYLLQRPAL
jgi:4-amino-4-deoxy-L-arabinose transferase-like glycosyltransferase